VLRGYPLYVSIPLYEEEYSMPGIGVFSHTCYSIAILDSSARSIVYRRYKAFKHLDRELRREFAMCPQFLGGLPILPAKRFFGNKAIQFIEERRRQLERYVATLLGSVAVHSDLMWSFLDLPANAAAVPRLLVVAREAHNEPDNVLEQLTVVRRLVLNDHEVFRCENHALMDCLLTLGKKGASQGRWSWVEHIAHILVPVLARPRAQEIFDDLDGAANLLALLEQAFQDGEDDDHDRRSAAALLEEVLVDSTLRNRPCYKGLHALALLERGQFTCASVLWASMPDVRGLDLCRLLANSPEQDTQLLAVLCLGHLLRARELASVPDCSHLNRDAACTPRLVARACRGEGATKLAAVLGGGEVDGVSALACCVLSEAVRQGTLMDVSCFQEALERLVDGPDPPLRVRAAQILLSAKETCAKLVPQMRDKMLTAMRERWPPPTPPFADEIFVGVHEP
jgi:CheY-like chemotaxis protein